MLAAFAASATAGPPYQTDDPEPTELRHWEIYAFESADVQHTIVDGEAGLDLNYGAVKDVQLTATLPLSFARDAGSEWRIGRGDVELGVKYRFVHDEAKGLQAAIFPRLIMPTASRGLGGARVRLLLPLWVEKDWGSTALFGGGGFEINPGSGNRNFWEAALALTHDVNSRTSLGLEITHQSHDTAGGSSSTGFSVGLIEKLGGPYSLLLAAGPNFSGGATGYHSYAALALNF